MAYQEIRDRDGKLVCEYDRETETVRVQRRKEKREASLKDVRIERGNCTDSNR